MMKRALFDELVKQVSGALPPGSGSLKADFEKNLQAVLHSFFAKMDLVSREEFEVQSKVLQRSRAKIEELERRLDELERQHHTTP